MQDPYTRLSIFPADLSILIWNDTALEMVLKHTVSPLLSTRRFSLIFWTTFDPHNFRFVSSSKLDREAICEQYQTCSWY